MLRPLLLLRPLHTTLGKNQPRVRSSQTCTKEGRYAPRMGRVCRKTMNRGGAALSFGGHVRAPCSAYVCRQFPHGLRRCGAASSRSRVLGPVDDDAAGARERGRLSGNGERYDVGLVQEDGRDGMVARRRSAGGHENSGKTRANQGSGSQVLHAGKAIFEDGSGAGNGSF